MREARIRLVSGSAAGRGFLARHLEQFDAAPLADVASQWVELPDLDLPSKQASTGRLEIGCTLLHWKDNGNLNLGRRSFVRQVLHPCWASLNVTVPRHPGNEIQSVLCRFCNRGVPDTGRHRRQDPEFVWRFGPLHLSKRPAEQGIRHFRHSF